MKKKLGAILLVMVLALALAIPMAMPVMAAPDTLTVVSDTTAEWSADGTTWSATAPCYVHPSWPAPASISGATWVWRGEPQNPALEYDTVPPGGWYFQKTFNLPVGAVPTSGSISIGADNAYSLEVNGNAIGGDGVLNRDGPDQSQWSSIETYDISSALTTGANTFNIRAINYFKVLPPPPPYPPTYSPGYNYDSPTLNPAGLIFKATIEYTLAALTGLTPDEAFNLVGTTHTVYATITPPVAGVPITFAVTGANTAGGTVNTEANGVAEFTYTGENPGEDTITATLGDVTLQVTKYWFQENFVTGGAKINFNNSAFDPPIPGGKKPAFTFGGTVGFLPDGSIVGQFQMVIHIDIGLGIKGAITIHLNSFSSLVFSGGPTGSPPASFNIATFTGTGFSNKIDDVGYLTIIITDNGEPGKGIDTIVIFGLIEGDVPIVIDGGNFQVHDGYKD